MPLAVQVVVHLLHVLQPQGELALRCVRHLALPPAAAVARQWVRRGGRLPVSLVSGKVILYYKHPGGYRYYYYTAQESTKNQMYGRRSTFLLLVEEPCAVVDCRSMCRRVCSAVQRESAAGLYNAD